MQQKPALTVTQVTNTGKALRAAISPDGKYVLNVQDDNGLQSLWLRNVPTGSDTQIVPPAEATYDSLTFSPDANYVYFRKAGLNSQSEWDLYRSPVLGGTPQLVVRDVDTGIAFSPDGHRMAFARANDPEVGKYRLLTANPDGNDETILRIAPNRGDDFARHVSWSPDGKRIAYSVYTLGEVLGAIKTFDVASQQVQTLSSFPNELVHDIAWLPTGQWLFALYQGKGPGYGQAQIGMIPRSGGTIQPVTRDTNGYSALTLSADGKIAATVQVRITRSLSLLPGSGIQGNPPVETSAPAQDANSVAWADNGKLLVSSGQSLQLMNRDGGQATTLLSDPNSWILDMERCGDRYIVLSWAFHGGTNGAHIWRANTNGSNLKQLTKGNFDQDPVCSPDGKWVYYYNGTGPHWTMRVPLEGGESEPVPSSDVQGAYGLGGGMAISPDGKQFAFNVDITDPADPQGAVSKLAVVNLDSTSQGSSRQFNPDRRIAGGGGGGIFHNTLTFTPDAKSVAYIIRDQGVDNLFAQPLDGSPGHQITNFTSDRIAKFEWSPDGKTLAVARFHNTSDVVLLREK